MANAKRTRERENAHSPGRLRTLRHHQHHRIGSSLLPFLSVCPSAVTRWSRSPNRCFTPRRSVAPSQARCAKPLCVRLIGPPYPRPPLQKRVLVGWVAECHWVGSCFSRVFSRSPAFNAWLLWQWSWWCPRPTRLSSTRARLTGQPGSQADRA